MIADYNLFGIETFQIKPDRTIEDDMGLDRCTAFWQSNNEQTFRAGKPLPNRPHMIMCEVDTQPEIEDHAYEHTIQCEGILGGLPYKLLPRRENSPHEGFDEIEQPILTRFPRDPIWARGTALPDIPTMWLVDISRQQHRARGFYDQTLIYKGLMDGKPAKRRGGTQTFTWTGDEIAFGLIEQGVFGYPPQAGGFNFPAGGFQKWEVDQPGQSVNDVLISLEPPPTWLVPGFWVPPNAPPIKLMPFVASEAPTFYWPHGWQVASMFYEQILDKNCWLISITWATKPSSTPNGKSSNIIRL